MCKDFYDEEYLCAHCMEGETIIDCIDVPIKSYNKAGETIVGDLKIYG